MSQLLVSCREFMGGKVDYNTKNRIVKNTALITDKNNFSSNVHNLEIKKKLK